MASWLGLLYTLVHKSQRRQLLIKAMLTSHLSVSRWAKPSDDLALSGWVKGPHKGIDSGKYNSQDFSITTYHKLHGAVSPCLGIPLEQA